MIEQQQRTIETMKQVIEYHKGLHKEQKDAILDLQQRLTRIEGRSSQPPPAPSAPKPQPPGAPKPAVNVPAQAQTARHLKRRRRRQKQQDNDNNDEPEEGDEPSLEEKLAADQSELDMMVSAFDSSSSSSASSSSSSSAQPMHPPANLPPAAASQEKKRQPIEPAGVSNPAAKANANGNERKANDLPRRASVSSLSALSSPSLEWKQKKQQQQKKAAGKAKANKKASKKDEDSEESSDSEPTTKGSKKKKPKTKPRPKPAVLEKLFTEEVNKQMVFTTNEEDSVTIEYVTFAFMSCIINGKDHSPELDQPIKQVVRDCVTAIDRLYAANKPKDSASVGRWMFAEIQKYWHVLPARSKKITPAILTAKLSELLELQQL